MKEAAISKYKIKNDKLWKKIPYSIPQDSNKYGRKKIHALIKQEFWFLVNLNISSRKWSLYYNRIMTTSRNATKECKGSISTRAFHILQSSSILVYLLCRWPSIGILLEANIDKWAEFWWKFVFGWWWRWIIQDLA